MGHFRSLGGHLVTRDSNLIAQSTQRPKDPMKRPITCLKVRFGKKAMFPGPYGSLEVIWRSFGLDTQI